MSRHTADKIPVSFQDVAACFSKVEHKLLYDWQKEVYKTVMKEIHQALISLGPAIAASIFSLTVEENEDLTLVNNQDSNRRNLNELSPRKEVNKEIALESMIDNEEADPMDCQVSIETQNVHYPTEVSCIVSVVEEEIEELTSVNQGLSYLVSETESCCIDLTETERTENSIGASSEHESERESVNGNQSRTCCECKKKCSWNASLEEHQGNHESDDRFRCTECEKRFSNTAPLQAQQRINSDLKSFPCTECGKIFYHKTNYVHHQRIHSGVKPFSCTECDKSFAQKINLLTHQKVHTRDRPFHCMVCDQRFSMKTHLLEHLKIHTVKTFSCSQCEKSFTNEPALSLHMRLHTGLRPFTCIECPKSFTCKSYLLRHLKIHTKSHHV